jgi:transposase InsO family protein
MAWREESIVSQRMEFVSLASGESANVRELCRRFRISAPTGYKWLARHRQGGGEALLTDRSRRPHSSPARCDAATEAAVLRVRDQHPAWGARKIRAVLARCGDGGDGGVPAASTVHAILVRHGRVDPAEKQKHRPWRRFEHDRPNALWQMDFKGHVPMHRGGRCHPLTILDDCSRFSIGLWACGDEQRPTVQGHLIEAFRRCGLPERVLCDNAPPWGVSSMNHRHTRLTVWLLRLGVRTVHGRACHPQTQGKEERFHRTLKAELLARTDLRDLRQAQEAFDDWRGTYNLRRPHEALAMDVPASRYAPSARTYPEKLPEPEYAPGETLRRVMHDGSIRFAGGTWFVGEAFGGEWVAIRPGQAEGTVQVCYGPHPLGTIDPPPGRSGRRRRPPLAALAPTAGDAEDDEV